jgi:hypothetical protein
MILCGPIIVRQHRDAVLDRLERDPAITLEELARPHLRGDLVEPLVVEMPVHAVEPGCYPAAARLEKRDARSRVGSATPPQITLIAANIISIVWQIMWRAGWSASKPPTPTVGIAVVEPS